MMDKLHRTKYLLQIHANPGICKGKIRHMNTMNIQERTYNPEVSQFDAGMFETHPTLGEITTNSLNRYCMGSFKTCELS